MIENLQEIRNQLGKNNTEKAINLLEAEIQKSADTELLNSLIILKSRFISLIENNVKGTISYDDYSKSLAQINDGVLILIEKIPNFKSLKKERIILFIYSNPNEKYNLGFEKEVEQIRSALQNGRKGSEFGLVVEVSVNFDDIEGLVEKYQPEIIHFCIWSLKNQGEGLFLFSGTKELEVEVHKDEFEQEFKEIMKTNNSINTIVLNTCFSQDYGKMISKYVKNVIAMNDLIEDEFFPFEFSRLLYTNLCNGKDIVESFQKTISRLKTNNELKKYNFIDKAPHEIPVLYY